MDQSRRICVLSEMNTAYGRGFVRGAARYARQHGPWMFLFHPDGARATLERLEEFACDGVLAQVTSAEVAERLTALSVPVVALGETPWSEQFPRVSVEQETVGRAAAEHLLQRGLKHFAYLGFTGCALDQARERGFAGAVREAGYRLEPADHDLPEDEHRMIALNRLARWLLNLPRPAGLLCTSDFRAMMALEAAHRAPVRVPDELAVVGVDDDELLRELSYPDLSSVRLPFGRIGQEAAMMLDHLMSGQSVPNQTVRLRPVGVKGRQSSDVLAIPDREVAAAVRFIREHAREPIQVTDVVEAVTISRRALERRFRQALGHAPQAEIQAAHIEAARHLLAETDLTIPEVARQSGFTHPDRLAAAFRRAVALTPTAYRNQYRH